jgi:hypothetical protein
MFVDATEITAPDRPPEAGDKTDRVNAGSQPRPQKSASPQVEKPDGRAQTPAPKTDRSKWESGDQYAGVLFIVPGTNWRMAVCAKGYCWMLQQREGRDRWISRKFFTNKRRLAVVLTELVGEQIAAAVKDKIEALPI